MHYIFRDTVQTLMTESGCRLDHPEACRFRQSILTGNWKEADDALLELEGMLEDPDIVTVNIYIASLRYFTTYLSLLSTIINALMILKALFAFCTIFVQKSVNWTLP